MSETMSQVIAGVYTLLKRPSEQQLPYEDVRERVTDDLKGYVQDQSLSVRGHLTEREPITFIRDDIDYIVSLPTVPDFEPERLEYGGYSGTSEYWHEALIVPPGAWTGHYSGDRVAASFYGSSSLQQGVKVRLNIDPSGYSWRMSYRPSLLSSVQSGSRPPIPSNHLPMVKRKSAIGLMPLVDDDSPEWIAWMARTLPIYMGLLQQDEERWRDYLTSSIEPQVQPIQPYNAFRRRGRRNPRAYLPIG